jgi:hypothetical protein
VERFGRYELLRRLGQGGMAEVFLARLASGDAAKYLAIKRLLPTYSQKPRVVRRLANEARLTVWLTHPNIVQVFDFGRVDGLYFIAMEFVDGCDLRSVIRPSGRQQRGTQLPLEVALDVGLQLCDALRYAHRCTDGEGQPLGIIHRDISPHNVLISRDGHPKLADFGVARAAISDDLSRPGAVLGKLSYMPPEQAQGLPYDARVDIYASGAVLYEMLTGVRPFANSNRLTASVERRPDAPSSLRPSIPRGLDELVLRAMSPQADERFGDAAALGDALEGQLGALGGRPKPHQLAGLVREALGAAQRGRPGFIPATTRVERQRGARPSAEVQAAEQSISPSVDLREYDPGEDSLIEPEVTAVRSFLGVGTSAGGSVGQARGAEWFQPRERRDTRRSTGPEVATQRRELPSEQSEADSETTSDEASPSELGATDTVELEPAAIAPPDRRAPRAEHEPAVELRARLLAWAQPRWRQLAAAGGGLLLFLLGLGVGRCTASAPSAPGVRPAIVVPSPRAGAAPAEASESRVASRPPSPRDAGAAADIGKRDVGQRGVAARVPPRPARRRSTARQVRLRSQIMTSFFSNNYRRALQLGRQYLRAGPKDQSVLAVVGASACKLRKTRQARRAYLQLKLARRAMLRRVCQVEGITF